MNEFFKIKDEEIGTKISKNKLEENNKIYLELKQLWNDNQISIINNILVQVEEDKNNSKEWLEALDIILTSRKM